MKKIILILVLILFSIIIARAQEFKISPELKKALSIKKELGNRFYYYETIHYYYENFNILNGIPTITFVDPKLSINNLKINLKEFRINDFKIRLYLKIYF